MWCSCPFFKSLHISPSLFDTQSFFTRYKIDAFFMRIPQVLTDLSLVLWLSSYVTNHAADLHLCTITWLQCFMLLISKSVCFVVSNQCERTTYLCNLGTLQWLMLHILWMQTKHFEVLKEACFCAFLEKLKAKITQCFGLWPKTQGFFL